MRRAVARRERAQNAERRCARRSAVRKEDKEQGCDSSADRQVHSQESGESTYFETRSLGGRLPRAYVMTDFAWMAWHPHRSHKFSPHFQGCFSPRLESFVPCVPPSHFLPLRSPKSERVRGARSRSLAPRILSRHRRFLPFPRSDPST